ncbi:MAG TPA: hypothetical protein PKE06_11055 [Flavilitoribacter sp.]|nr:hypothetical protein [Flavilitoribacter sp.]HMQ90254.1 hypothetical protein [Flavilitoribacter sp.]
MRKQIIATVVGALILFIWQFLSWAMLGVHQSEFKYTANQDQILEVLNQNLSEEGTYFIPGVPPGTSYEDETAMMEAAAGKPWATVSYHKSMNTSMGMNMVRAFLIDLVAIWLLVWILMKFGSLTVMSAVQTSLAFGIMAYLTIPYLNSIWFEGNSLGYIVDAIVQWGLIGLWSGWWLTRK